MKTLEKTAFLVFAIAVLATSGKANAASRVQTEESRPADGRALSRQDLFVTTEDGVSIHVLRKFGPEAHKVPVLLVHGTWGNAQTWDFPDRSVMDYLARRGHDVYALDLRGMGESDRPADYFTIGLLDRVRDLSAAAAHIVATTGRRAVVCGFSQGGLLTGLLAASRPDLVAGVGLFSIPGNGFHVPPEVLAAFESVVASGVDRVLPAPELLTIAFGTDPVTGRSTINPEAFATFVALSEPDGVRVIVEELSPQFFQAVVEPAWPAIHVPALVVDGAQDVLVGEARAEALFTALGSDRKQLFLLPRNAHAWFLEDNHNAGLRVFDRFLSQFKSDEE
jgi:pimeloyl-ACP methyl ester carboxylesterase